MTEAIRSLTDDQLEEKLLALARAEQSATLDVIAHLAELHRRHLATRRGYSGLYRYCTEKLGYSPDEAMRRITVARRAVEFPSILSLLAEGRITVTNVNLISPALSSENHQELLNRTAGKTRLEVERMLAELAPQPDKRDHIQTLSVTAPAPSTPETVTADDLPLLTASPAPAAPPLPPAIPPPPAPPGGARVHFGFTGSEELRKKLDRAKEILWHSFPDGRLEDIVGQALDDLLEKRDPARKDSPRKPAAAAAAGVAERSRYIPVWVRAEVWKRDGGRCAFTTSDGVRCGETAALQYDHVIPYALGGASDEPTNIRLLCFPHNQLLARHAFGDDWRPGQAAAEAAG